jgi:hypothetical protein
MPLQDMQIFIQLLIVEVKIATRALQHQEIKNLLVENLRALDYLTEEGYT